MIHQLAHDLSVYLGKELGLDTRRVFIVSYGLEVVIGGLIKLLVFITIPILLGISKLFFVALLSAAILRLPSGGVHNNAYYKCLICTLSIFLLIAFIGQGLSRFDMPLNIIVPLIISFVFTILLKVAPVSVNEKPIKSPQRRTNLKVVSCIILIIYGAIFFLIRPDKDIIITSLVSILFHTFTLTKAGAYTFSKIDILLDIRWGVKK